MIPTFSAFISSAFISIENNYINHNGRQHPTIGMRSLPQSTFIEEENSDKENNDECAEPPLKRRKIDEFLVEENQEDDAMDIDEGQAIQQVESVDLPQELWDSICEHNLKNKSPDDFWNEAKNLILVCQAVRRAVFKWMPKERLSLLVQGHGRGDVDPDRITSFLRIFGGSLSYLDIDGSIKLNPQQTAIISHLPKIQKLKIYSGSKMKLPAAKEILEKAQFSEKLHSFSMYRDSWSADYSSILEMICNVAKFPNLRELHSSYHMITQSNLRTMSKLEQGLRTLEIQNGQLGNEGLETIAEDKKFANLQALSLINNGITPIGIEKLAKSPYIHSLRSLNLSNNTCNGKTFNNTIESQGFITLAKSSKFSTLQELRLANNGSFNDSSHAVIPSSTELQGFSNLEVLDLSGNHIDVTFLQILAKIPLPCLKTLILARNKLGQKEAAILSEITNIPNLATLDLSSTQIGLRAIKILTRASGFKKLETIILNNNPIERKDTHVLWEALPSLKTIMTSN